MSKHRRNGNGPFLIRHMDLLWLLRPAPSRWRCPLCQGAEKAFEDAPCERCGVVMHWTCYPAALSEAERIADAAATEADDNDFFAKFIILCPGCRS